MATNFSEAVAQLEAIREMHRGSHWCVDGPDGWVLRFNEGWEPCPTLRIIDADSPWLFIHAWATGRKDYAAPTLCGVDPVEGRHLAIAEDGINCPKCLGSINVALEKRMNESQRTY